MLTDTINRGAISAADANWIADLYGAESLPRTLAGVHRDFDGFVNVRWLTLEQKPRFLRVMRELINNV